MEAAICVICTGPIDPLCLLLSPCCKTTAGHQECFEISQTVGNFTFKCPACTVKKEAKDINDTLMNFDPERKEESEGNFSVKVEVGCSTDGRASRRLGTQWEVVVCNTCKSVGTHRRCSEVQLSNQWQCLNCQNVPVKLESVDIPWEDEWEDEIFSYQDLEAFKTEATEDVAGRASPEILKGGIKYHSCVVPQCKNTSIKTPSKLFIDVPRKPEIRQKWFDLARRPYNGKSSSIYFCEDHFDRGTNTGQGTVKYVYAMKQIASL